MQTNTSKLAIDGGTPVAESIAMMCRGNFSDGSSALRFLQRNATKRVARKSGPRKTMSFKRDRR